MNAEQKIKLLLEAADEIEATWEEALHALNDLGEPFPAGLAVALEHLRNAVREVRS